MVVRAAYKRQDLSFLYIVFFIYPLIPLFIKCATVQRARIPPTLLSFSATTDLDTLIRCHAREVLPTECRICAEIEVGQAGILLVAQISPFPTPAMSCPPQGQKRHFFTGPSGVTKSESPIGFGVPGGASS
jgi:hypothetical protein